MSDPTRRERLIILVTVLVVIASSITGAVIFVLENHFAMALLLAGISGVCLLAAGKDLFKKLQCNNR